MYETGMTLEQVEKQTILDAFKFHRGNKTKTAQALGIAIRTLDHKLEQYHAAKEKPLVDRVELTKDQRIAAARETLAATEEARIENQAAEPTAQPVWKPKSKTTRAEDIAAEKAATKKMLEDAAKGKAVTPAAKRAEKERERMAADTKKQLDRQPKIQVPNVVSPPAAHKRNA